ncbi:hypothetical protein EIN_495410 [Entamoeba invadens IP1]|uniref:Uncharacterized protein n=1 Tax=Entamoeba invadens IP1 TaxID=370355 RepID=A0A0A1TZQ8_ENTIV|nr:hypothetical protein EIN_495410 [Entamoeba invadens IP1]ELP87086.1 hypothetical protein EIN_495410 [Entamoeba invadens IP1]|eukprot:XP_004253857.1 hypothetical protein EIN_495410 [Entamoeba invadens IP1]
MEEDRDCSATWDEINRVICPENMERIAARNASNSATILVIVNYVETLITSNSPKTYLKLKRLIEALLQDDSPNKEWILSLVSQLNNCDTTKAMYTELYEIITHH